MKVWRGGRIRDLFWRLACPAVARALWCRRKQSQRRPHLLLLEHRGLPCRAAQSSRVRSLEHRRRHRCLLHVSDQP